jgi:hypothetical protein
VEHPQDQDRHPIPPGSAGRRPIDPAYPPGTASGRIRPGWRAAAGLGAAASVPAVAIAWFSGVVVFSGCFIACDPDAADPLGGLLLFLLAGACFAAGAVCVKLAATGRTAGTARVVAVSAVVAMLLAMLSAAF